MGYKVKKFSASWCGPCRMLDQKLKDFKMCEVEKIDVDKMDEDVLAGYKIRNIPTTIIFNDNDEEVSRFVGLFNVQDLENKLKELENG